MKIAHKFGDHNKIVKGSKHHFDPGGSPGGAQLPVAGAGGALGGGMDASGGSAAGYADGGGIWDKIKDVYNQVTQKQPEAPAGTAANQPLASSDQTSKGAGKEGAKQTKATLDQADEMSK